MGYWRLLRGEIMEQITTIKAYDNGWVVNYFDNDTEQWYDHVVTTNSELKTLLEEIFA